MKSEIKKFDNECKGEIGTRDALRKSVNLWKEFNFLRVSGDYLFNYHRYYYILAKNDKITFRTGEQVQLSCLEPVLERVQYMMQHQYDAAIELQAKMSTISYLFTEKASSRSKRWSIKKNSESSPIKIIDRTLRNEGMNVDVINDNDLNSIWFTYNDRNQFVKQLRFFVDGAEKLESEISRSKFLDSVSKKI